MFSEDPLANNTTIIKTVIAVHHGLSDNTNKDVLDSQPFLAGAD